MTREPETYEDLVEKLVDDRLAEDEVYRLNEVLRRSADARDHYWHLVMLEGYLADLPGWIAGQQYATQLAFSETLEAFIEMESNAEATLQTYPEPSDDAAEPKRRNDTITWRDVRTVGVFCLRTIARQKITRGLAAAAVFCVAALIAVSVFDGSDNQTHTTQQLTETNPQTPPNRPPSTVAKVVQRTFRANVEGFQIYRPGTDLVSGDVIELQRDEAIQLDFRSGADVILRGPGAFSLNSQERLSIRHGRLSAIVPPRATGFTVSTQQTDFVDLGTEFAVELDREGRCEIAVIDGLVEAKPADVAAPLVTGQPRTTLVHEGFTARFVPDKPLPESVTPFDPQQVDRFVRSWDQIVYRPEYSGQIVYTSPPPASLAVGQAKSNEPLLIPERRGVVLAEDLRLNANKANRILLKQKGISLDPAADYVIPAGTHLNSFLIHFELEKPGEEGAVERDFKLRFNGRIVAIIDSHQVQHATDALFGLTDTTYPKVNSPRGAADPPGHPNHDQIYVSDDLRTLAIKMRLSGMDQIRVLVENTDP